MDLEESQEGSSSSKMEVDDGGESSSSQITSQSQSQSRAKTVQALRQYLQRKLSSEESSTEADIIRGGESGEVETSKASAEAPEGSSSEDRLPSSKSSRLTCSIVYSGPSSSSDHRRAGNFPFQKQRSLDTPNTSTSNPLGSSVLQQGPYPFHYSSSSSFTPNTAPATATTTTTIDDVRRYLVTDLCVPVLLSRCTLCDASFELDSQLREHISRAHVLDPEEEEEEQAEVLDLSTKEGRRASSGSLPNLNSNDGSLLFPLAFLGLDAVAFRQSTFSRMIPAKNGGGPGGVTKQQVKCMTCGKAFSTKWNWKQHQKIHLRENLQAFMQ